MFDLLLYSGMLCADADALMLKNQSKQIRITTKSGNRVGRDRKGICTRMSLGRKRLKERG